MTTTRLCTLLIVTCAIALMSSAARAAETLQAPPEVMAGPDGSFTYEFGLRKGPGTATFGGIDWLGTVNVDGFSISDGFCIATVVEGQIIRAIVNARLKDPSLPGKVWESISLCGGGGGDDSTTVIRPYSALDVGGGPSASVNRLWNEPNPFSRETTFHFSLSEPSEVELSVHDIAGRKVASVVEGEQSAGPHEVSWRLASGSLASGAGGVLFARLRVGGVVLSRRLVLLR